jgi:hypothetical protein
MEDLQPIKAQLTIEGFNELFERFMADDITYTQAYLKAEEFHVKMFGSIRYKSYESFRASRHNFLFGKK